MKRRQGISARAWFYAQPGFHSLPEPTPSVWGLSTCPRCGHLLPEDAHCPCQLAATEEANRSIAPRCERCGQPEEDWPDFQLNEADECSTCTMAYGLQHFAPYHLRAAWHAKGGHCRCADCAPPQPTCRRGLDDAQCDVRCCVICDADERAGDTHRCAACLTDQEMERRADEDLDARDRRLMCCDDRTPADHDLDRWKARRDDGR